jgi:predicted dehydrogenase
VDVITCATPDHWHALIAIMAFQSGKDVYGEKPLSHSAAEGQAMLGNKQRYRSIFQLGTQIHAGENYHRVVEILQSGILGKIDTVRLWKTGYDPKFGFPPNETPPKTLDWDRWLGPAPYVDYNPVRCHGTFRFFYDYSGGTFADYWCHIADIAFWALNPKDLQCVEATGEAPNGMSETPIRIEVKYKYNNLDLYWTTVPPDIPWAKGRHIGAYFEGTEGTLACDYESRQIRLKNEIVEDIPEIPITIPRSPGHQRNFLDSVKSRKQPESNLEYVRKMTLPMHLGLISFRLKRKLFWDSHKERFTNDHAANYLLSRPYRSPWILPQYIPANT